MENEFTAEKLRRIFNIDNQNEYVDFKYYTSKDGVGFSVKRKYPEGLLYKPPQKANNEPDTVALIHVFFIISRKNKNDKLQKTPLILNILPYSKYLSKHPDYDFIDPQCPTEKSVILSKTTPSPIELELENDYFFDNQTGHIVDTGNNKIEGQELLNIIFNLHCNTVRSFKALKFRFKVNLKNIGLPLSDKFIQFLKWLLKIFFGRELEPKNPFSGFLDKYEKEDLKLAQPEYYEIEFLGYKGSKRVVLTFCFLIIFGYTIFYFFKINSLFLKGIIINNFLFICFAIISLSFLDHIAPRILFWLINKLIVFRKYLIVKKIIYKKKLK